METGNKYGTREEWLAGAVEILRDLYDIDIPFTRVSCGFPSGGGRGNGKRVGECHYAAADKVPQVFIHPVIVDPVKVLDILAHELIHAALPIGSGHKASSFGKVARSIGLEGKLTATVAGADLTAALTIVADTLGEYPHAGLDSSSGAKKQTTRMIKCECGECGYVARTTRIWLERSGSPICPECMVRMDVQES